MKRSITLMDGMILIAATGFGLAWWRVLKPYGFFTFYPQSAGWSTVPILPIWRTRMKVSLSIALDFYPLLVTHSFALLLLRLRWPRPGLARLARQPGFIALCAVITGFLAAIIELVAAQVVFGDMRLFIKAIFERNILANYLYPGNGLDFAGMGEKIFPRDRFRLGDSCRSPSSSAPKKTWIDQAGRILGMIWIALYVCHLLVPGGFTKSHQFLRHQAGNAGGVTEGRSRLTAPVRVP